MYAKKWACPITKTTTPMPVHAAQDQPSAWVSRFAGLIRPGLVLDMACGGGRHARLLASLGHTVLAVDRNQAALDLLRADGIDTLCFDLEHEQASSHADWPFSPQRFAGIVITNYLHRPLFDAILDSLAPGGVLIIETFAAGNAEFGKPSNPAFLLQAGELLAVAQQQSGMRVLAFEDGYVASPRPAMVQRLCAIHTGAAVSAPQLLLA